MIIKRVAQHWFHAVRSSDEGLENRVQNGFRKNWLTLELRIIMVME